MTTGDTAAAAIRHGSDTTVVAVASTYALQGLGYAVVVTALPSFQTRHALDATLVAIILLGVCVAAAAGSVLADVVAVRGDSRRAVRVGFVLQAAALIVTALSPSLLVFAIAVAVYGVGLGAIDAASNMQGVMLERRRGRPWLGRLFAAYTTGAIIGAIVMSAVLATRAGALVALLVAAVLHLAFLFLLSPALDDARAARAPRTSGARPGAAIPAGPVVAIGCLVLAAFTVDAAVSTWSSVHLTSLGVAAALAPLGYAVYQAGVLGARLLVDPVTRRLGRARLSVVGVVLGVVGGLVVALAPGAGAAVVAFALSGLAVGALVPLAFGAAGSILPERTDEVVARVNLFNYIGALLGAVGVGVLIDGVGAFAFLLPTIVLLSALSGSRWMNRSASDRPPPTAGMGGTSQGTTTSLPG
jgi:MFS family permease